METYLVLRIEAGKLDYKAVITKFPQYKTVIDKTLTDDGFQNKIIV